MRVTAEDYFIHLYDQVKAVGAGLDSKFLSTDSSNCAKFSYYEKGSRIPGQPSMIFIHGFGTDKSVWVAVARNISSGYHCIMIDLPGFGETVGLVGDEHNVDKIIDELKLFFDKMNLTEPLYIIGHSLGGTFAAMFTVKYPQYVSLLCLTSLPPPKALESNLARNLRSAMGNLTEAVTPEQIYAVRDMLGPETKHVSKSFLDNYRKPELPVTPNQHRIMSSFLEDEYDNLGQYYEQLRLIKCPGLILWGREDKVCESDNADYFSKLISDSEVIIFENCGHSVSTTKPKEMAKSILSFLDLNSYCLIEHVE